MYEQAVSRRSRRSRRSTGAGRSTARWPVGSGTRTIARRRRKEGQRRARRGRGVRALRRPGRSDTPYRGRCGSPPQQRRGRTDPLRTTFFSHIRPLSILPGAAGAGPGKVAPEVWCSDECLRWLARLYPPAELSEEQPLDIMRRLKSLRKSHRRFSFARVTCYGCRGNREAACRGWRPAAPAGSTRGGGGANETHADRREKGSEAASLSELGITKDQSADWQRRARVRCKGTAGAEPTPPTAWLLEMKPKLCKSRTGRAQCRANSAQSLGVRVQSCGKVIADGATVVERRLTSATCPLLLFQ